MCRPCKNEKTKEYHHRHPEKVRQYDYKYEKRNKEKRQAKAAIKMAIRDRGFEPQPCQVCGRKDDIESHHTSYDPKDILKIIWLCPICHKGAHTGIVDVSELPHYTAPPIQGRWPKQTTKKVDFFMYFTILSQTISERWLVLMSVWIPKRIVATGTGDVTVKLGPGDIANVLVETAGVTVYLKDGEYQVYADLEGVDQDNFNDTPIHFSNSIVLNFSAAGAASIIYK